MQKLANALLVITTILGILIIYSALNRASAHDLPGIPAENQAWYQNAETNPDSTPRTTYGWHYCCNHAEVIDAKYIVRLRRQGRLAVE